MKKYAEEGQAKDNSELEYYYFQNLCFLIRDWDDKDHEHGLDGGQQYLDELRQKMKLTGQLDKTFQEMKCFLIPYPGQAIRESYEPGVEGFLPAKNLDGKFKKNLEKLFCFLFEKLVDVKRLRNCPLTGESFLHLCCELNKLLKSSNLLEPLSTMKVFASVETSITCKELVDSCKNKMDSLKDKVVSKKELQNILDKLEKDSAKELRDIYNFPYEDVKAEQELFLKRDIQALYPHYESEVSTREIEVRRHFEELLEKCFTVFKEKIEKEIEVAKMEAKESFKKECPEVPFLSDEYEEKLQLKMEKIFEKEKEVEKDEQTQSHSLQNKLNAEEISTTKKKELDATFIPLDKIDEVSDDKGFLGRGSFGTIRLAFTDGHGAVAIKRFNTTGTRTKIDDENSKMIETVRNYKMAAHENLVRLHGYSKWPDAQIGIVMEYMPGRNLDDFLFAKKKDGNYKISRIPAVIQLRICDDVASGIAFLHYGFSKNLRMTHGDLKPENVLLTTDLRCKVSDLDGAHLATCTEAQTTKKKQENIIHTCLYSAPERLRGSTCRTSKAMDVYSYSLICYIVITRVLPFPETWQREDLVANVANGHYRPSLDKVKCVKKDFRRNDAEIIDLLCQEMVKCWQEQPEKRPTISEVRDIFHRKFAAADQSEVAADVAEITREMDIKIPDRSQYKFKSNTEENMSISKPAISDTKQSRLIYDQDNSLDYC
ncbi:unnamed protein product [Clavelina lepadiformis]|uniref:Protein kinase domain-containing protein n=1 Tax=Clavelina lepadiformis TaxID=159417 RepID=A0ABP0F079_CLALP